MEGYLFDRPAAKKAFRAAAEIAHANDRRVSLTLSDSFCVDRHRDDFLALVRDEVDILFGNTDELLALYQVAIARRGARHRRRDCDVAAITHGADGSFVVTPAEVVSVPAEPVKRVLDTTGAGDLYAAGFLYGFTQRSAARRMRPARLDRRQRGDLAHRSEAARRTSYAVAVSASAVGTACARRADGRRALARRRARRRHPHRAVRPCSTATTTTLDRAIRRSARSSAPPGLRAEVGAGSMRMNRLVVRQAAAGLARSSARHRPDDRRRGAS